MGAASVVQGQFSTDTGERFAIQASVVRASDAEVAATSRSADHLARLFDLEKQVVFQLIGRLGITLTPQESAAISERPTRDITAFLLYSRGLEAQDRGDYGAAARSFQAAAQRDPSFGAAAQQAQASQAAGAAAAPPADVAATVAGSTAQTGETGGGGDALRGAINDATPTGAGALSVCEAAGCAGPPNATLIGVIIITVKKP